MIVTGALGARRMVSFVPTAVMMSSSTTISVDIVLGQLFKT